jgi:hypothetical protein
MDREQTQRQIEELELDKAIDEENNTVMHASYGSTTAVLVTVIGVLAMILWKKGSKNEESPNFRTASIRSNRRRPRMRHMNWVDSKQDKNKEQSAHDTGIQEEEEDRANQENISSPDETPQEETRVKHEDDKHPSGRKFCQGLAAIIAAREKRQLTTPPADQKEQANLEDQEKP